MNEEDANYTNSAPCEGSEDLNGKDASYRSAPMISSPKSVLKRRVKGALVPMRKSI